MAQAKPASGGTSPQANVPPQNIEAEMAVLGAMLVSEPAAKAVIEEAKLDAADFYLDKHAVIFTAIRDLYAASKPVDPLTVEAALTTEQRKVIANGRASAKHYVSELAAKVPAPGNAKHYAEIVRRHASQRAKQTIGAELRNGLSSADAIKRLRDLERRTAQAGEDRCLRILDVGAMVASTPPDIPWVVEGVAIERTLTLLSGKEGEGKSLVSMALGAGVALGEDVAGFTCERRKVLVIDAENGEYEIHRRVKTLGLSSAGITVVEADDFHLGRDLSALDALIERKQPGLVILDSFRSLWPGGDENDSAAVAAVLDPLRNLLRRRGPAGILLHHISRAGNDYRGTSAIGAAIELGFRLSRHPDDPNARERRFLRCFKCRPAAEPDDRWLRLHLERDQVFIDVADPYVSEQGAERPTAPVRAELAPVLLAAAGEPIAWPVLARKINRSPKDGTARRLRDDLLAKGELVKLDDGRFKVPSGVAPADSALTNESKAGCQGAGTLTGAGAVAPTDSEPPCRYPDHRGSDYTGAGGGKVCGTCHPKPRGSA